MSFTHAAKATEPVFVVALSVGFFGKAYPGSVYLSLLPLVLGIALVSATDLSFTLSGLLAVALSNTCFSLRSIVAKQLLATSVVDNLNLYFYMSWLSALLVLPLALFTETSLVCFPPSPSW